jgi:hypothetical protein
MKYRVLRGFCIGAGKDVYPPEVIEMEEREGSIYVFQGRLEPVKEAEAPAGKPAKPADK